MQGCSRQLALACAVSRRQNLEGHVTKKCTSYRRLHSILTIHIAKSALFALTIHITCLAASVWPVLLHSSCLHVIVMSKGSSRPRQTAYWRQVATTWSISSSVSAFSHILLCFASQLPRLRLGNLSSSPRRICPPASTSDDIFPCRTSSPPIYTTYEGVRHVRGYEL
jgi:hypothetical protein